MDSQFPNFALMESWEIQNKGFQTIFKMTGKYKGFIEKNYEIALWSPFGPDFCGIYIYIFTNFKF